jgi:hypothetical protein
VGNVSACNNLSFSDEELPERGRNHNLALHVSVTCKSDALSNVLIDTGSSLNVMAKTTLDKLSYKDAYMIKDTRQGSTQWPMFCSLAFLKWKLFATLYTQKSPTIYSVKLDNLIHSPLHFLIFFT